MDHTILIKHLKHGVTTLVGEGLDAQQQYHLPNRYMLEAARVLEKQQVIIQQQQQHLQELQHNYQQAVDQINNLTKALHNAATNVEQVVPKEQS